MEASVTAKYGFPHPNPMKQAIAQVLNKPKDRKIAIGLALAGSVTPLAGIHKFYVGQPVWGVVYFLLWSTPIPQIACAIEAVWYLLQDFDSFQEKFSLATTTTDQTLAQAQQTTAIATALRELEKLRTEGLITEYEFEQKRRKLIN
jgi:TM2 domain-containing membrane protein YozV